MTTPPCMSFSLITVMKCLKKYLEEGTTLSCSLFQWITRIMNGQKEKKKKIRSDEIQNVLLCK